jgi:uncharacterized protein
MKITALEEHVLTPELLAAWAQVPTAKDDGVDQAGDGPLGQTLTEIGEQRLRDMDAAGVDVQVLDSADREKIAHGNWERLTAR